jgi:hypothetical protein
MFRWKTYAAGALLSIAASPAFAANPFADVPRTHWAYEAIQKAVDAGVLQGFDGKFMGEKTVNRYQMAVVVKRLLEVAGSGKGGGGGGAGVDVKNLEQLSIEFADELALLNTKVQTLEDSFVALRGEVDKMKGGSGNAGAGGGLTNAFTGFVSVGLIATDDGAPTGVGVPTGIRTRYTAGAPDQMFFTIPQASIGLDKEVGEGIGLHVQYDYGTNGLGVGATLDGNALGTAVGLNEAYLLVDEIFGDIGAKIGGFALPFQSWEVNGPFRTCNMTVTPSASGTFFEGIRVVGLEISKMKDVDPADFQWRLGIFNGADVAAGAPGTFFGGTSDVVGLAALQGSATFDDSFGFYFDLESGNDPDRNWGWRAGYFDLGGDNGNVGPGPAASTETDGWSAGFWWKRNDFKVILQYLDMQADGTGALGGETDADDLYLLANYQINDANSISLRYDGWSNENDAAGSTSEGDTITFGFNRKTSDTSMLQFEYQTVDEELSLPIGVTSLDADDDLVQFRYKVWF